MIFAQTEVAWKLRTLEIIWPDLIDFVLTGSRKCFCVKYNGGDVKFSIYFKQRNNDETNNNTGKQYIINLIA